MTDLAPPKWVLIDIEALMRDRATSCPIAAYVSLYAALRDLDTPEHFGHALIHVDVARRLTAEWNPRPFG